MSREKFKVDIDRYVNYVDQGMRPNYTIEKAGLGLGGEAGEVLNLLKKLTTYQEGEPAAEEIGKYELKLVEELGDVFWQWVALIRKLGYDVHTVVEFNIDKLEHKYNDKY